MSLLRFYLLYSMIPINNPTKEGDEQISDDIIDVIDVVCTFLVTLACGEHYPFITLLVTQ